MLPAFIGRRGNRTRWSHRTRRPPPPIYRVPLSISLSPWGRSPPLTSVQTSRGSSSEWSRRNCSRRDFRTSRSFQFNPQAFRPEQSSSKTRQREARLRRILHSSFRWRSKPAGNTKARIKLDQKEKAPHGAGPFGGTGLQTASRAGGRAAPLEGRHLFLSLHVLLNRADRSSDLICIPADH